MTADGRPRPPEAWRGSEPSARSARPARGPLIRLVDPAEVWESISDYPSLTAEVGPDSWYGARTTGVYIWNDGNCSEAVRPPR